jgi:hypothetical protein
MSFITWDWDFPQKEQRIFSSPPIIFLPDIVSLHLPE